MEYSIKSAPIRTVIGETKIEANISGGSISTTIGEGARMNVSQATVNVESGKAEIEKAVNQGKTVISDHTTEKIGEFDSNAVDKTQDFNDNASDKTQDFNDNYVDKKALIDAEVSTAQNAAAEAKQWAIGDPTEPTGNSAKYWAEEAATTLANKQDKLTVGTGIDITSNVISVTSPALINTATGSNSVAVATPSSVSANNAVAVGYNSYVSGYMGTAIGAYAKSTSSNAIQLGYGTNGEANSLYVGTSTSNNYKMLDNTGLIPDARISSNIARTSAIPSAYGAGLSYSSSSLQLLDQNGNNLGSAVTIKSTPDLDGVTIDTNSDDELEAIGVIDNNGNAIKTWTGTLAQYNAIATKDSNTLYNITDDVSITQTILEALYPVGSLYIGKMSTCPLAGLIPNSTWTLVASDKVLQGSGTYTAGTSVNAGLPNIQGTFGYLKQAVASNYNNPLNIKTGAFSASYETTTDPAQRLVSITATDADRSGVVDFKASNSNSIYGNSTTVQPSAYVVNIWERTA